MREFIDSGAIRFVQFDCTRYAGFSEALRIAQYAQDEGRAGRAAHRRAHPGAHRLGIRRRRLRAPSPSGDEGKHPIHHRIFHGGAVYRDGRVHLTEAPGFGLEVDWKAVKALRP